MSRRPRISEGRSCPLSPAPFELIRLTSRGVVFRSNRPFEIGDTFELGLHVSHGGQSRFINAEGAVVGSRRLGGAALPATYEITMVFAGLSDDASAVLECTEPLDPLQAVHSSLSKKLGLPGWPEMNGLN